jgi:hypothetical protein
MTTSKPASDRKYMEEKMMFSCTKDGIQNMQRLFTITTLVIFLGLSLGACTTSTSGQKEFKSPSDAVQAFVAALKTGNDKELLSILGPGGNEVISSGDEVDDLQGRQNFLKAYNEQNLITPEGEKFLLVIGKNDWPFPIPLVKKADRWVFDTASGKEEILNRRIGKNELDTIQVLLAIVDAQREYAMKDRDSDSFLQYAQKFKSDPGKKDGLYWQAQEGEASSPLGELVANARAEGYASEGEQNTPEPYYGYYYRILTAQGQNATGGSYDYLVDSRMIGGFAVVAHPAEYANSGVMTFTVNHDGVVNQKDLGENSGELAKAMQLYDPDETWMPVQ